MLSRHGLVLESAEELHEKAFRRRRERRPVVRQRRIPVAVIELYRSQDLAVCIIVTTWPPELPPRKSPSESMKSWGRTVPTNLPPHTWQCLRDKSWSPNAPFRFKNSLPNSPQVHKPGPCCVRMEFWRGTGVAHSKLLPFGLNHQIPLQPKVKYLKQSRGNISYHIRNTPWSLGSGDHDESLPYR